MNKDTLNSFYRHTQDWDNWPDSITDLKTITEGREKLSFYRFRNSHKGISHHQHVTHLNAKQVNQEFYDEICEMKGLQYLNIETLTAESLNNINKLTNLHTLVVYGANKATDLSPFTQLTNLQRLFLENTKHLNSLELFNKSHHLKALGVEGGMDKNQIVQSLKPLERLQSLEALFMTSVTLKDKDLTYLKNIPNLKLLSAARFAPKESFQKLREAMPNLICKWCDNYSV